MYKEIPKLIMYRDLGEDSIILSLAQIIKEFESGQYDKVGAILIPLFILVVALQFFSSYLRRRAN